MLCKNASPEAGNGVVSVGSARRSGCHGRTTFCPVALVVAGSFRLRLGAFIGVGVLAGLTVLKFCCC